jgi:hypothetical protein
MAIDQRPGGGGTRDPSGCATRENRFGHSQVISWSDDDIIRQVSKMADIFVRRLDDRIKVQLEPQCPRRQQWGHKPTVPSSRQIGVL